MAKVNVITVQQMIDQIKVEARIDGANTYDVTILGIINELLLDKTQTSRYSEFVKISDPISGVPGQGLYDQPDDLANIRTVYFSRSGQPDFGRIINHKNDFVEFSMSGEPKYYELIGPKLRLFPFTGILTTDRFWIEYFAMPDALVMNDEFPIAKLVPVIKREAIARMHRVMKDFNADDRMTKNADDTEKGEQTTENNSE